MRQIIGGMFSVIAFAAVVIFGIWGFVLDVAIVNRVGGFWALVVGFSFLPVMFAVAPWYALVAWGTFQPLIVQYGGMIAGGVLFAIGQFVGGEA